MEKELFVEYMTAIKNHSEEIDKFYDQCYELFGGFPDVGAKFLSEIINLLSKTIGDKDEWIDYYVFELKFGENCKNEFPVTINGIDYKLKTFDDLWNLIQLSK